MPLTRTFASLIFIISGPLASADEVLHRYEGDVVPYDPSAGWFIANPCDLTCTESIENGHFVLRWEPPGGALAQYSFTLATPETPPPPPALWVEWRFKSDHPLDPNFFRCDGEFIVKYAGMLDTVIMWADAVVSFSGNDFVVGLDGDEFHTYRFESLDGINYSFAVDGQVFHVRARDQSNGFHNIGLAGHGGCRGNPVTNYWDYVRFGTIESGEAIISTDPPAGALDPNVFDNLDRFTVTFDAANYVYINDITVEVSGGPLPRVIATRRRELDEPDTLEIILDRSVTVGQTTRFIFTDGDLVQTVEYDLTEGFVEVPAIPGWGLIALAMLILVGGAVAIRRAPVG